MENRVFQAVLVIVGLLAMNLLLVILDLQVPRGPLALLVPLA